MPLSKDTAIILHKNDLKEFDEIATMLTREHGVIQLVCRGSRRAKGRLRGTIEVLNLIDVVYYEKEGRELGNLNQASLLEGRLAIQSDMACLAVALFAAEVTRKLFPLADPHPEVFDTFQELLRRLPTVGAPSQESVRYLALLLPETGIAPQLGACIGCQGREDGDLVGFSAQHGGFLCAQCTEEDPAFIRLPGRMQQALRHLTEAPHRFDFGGFSLKELRLLRMVLLRCYEEQLDLRLKSLTFLLTAEEE